MQSPLFVIVLDSSGYRFDQKKLPLDLEISCYFSRGKSVGQLYDQTIAELWWVHSDRHVSFKFCAGINNFLQKENLRKQGSEFSTSSVTAGTFVETLADIKSKLKPRYPNSRVAFGTIPLVHFGDLQKSRLKSGLLKRAKYNSEGLVGLQDRVNAKLTLINAKIVESNNLKGFFRTLGLSEVIVKCHKKSCGRLNTKSKK